MNGCRFCFKLLYCFCRTAVLSPCSGKRAARRWALCCIVSACGVAGVGVLKFEARGAQVPIGSEDKLVGLVDLIDRQAYHFLGASGEQVPPPPPPPPTHTHTHIDPHTLAQAAGPCARQHSLDQKYCGPMPCEMIRSCRRHHPLNTAGAQKACSPPSPYTPVAPPAAQVTPVDTPPALAAQVEARRAELVERVRRPFLPPALV